MSRFTFVVALAVSACAPGDEPADSDVADEPAFVPEFGLEDQRDFDRIADEDEWLDSPRDLAFNPDDPSQLWIVNRTTDTMVILFDPGTPDQSDERRKDSFANHFMEEPAALAFGASGTFATCGESRNTYDGDAAANDFMGPALWSSELEVFAEANEGDGPLGSHLDMLHESPLCMGVAHDHDNVYWVFDGLNEHVVYYDFQGDHGPGYDDHSDGIVRRYPEAEVSYVEDVPGHLIVDQDTGWLYVADTGGGRILRLDTASGEVARSLREEMEPLVEYSEMEGATVEEFADGLEEPSGIALHDGRLFVSDHGTNEIVAYDLASGEELARIQTDAVGIMGLEFGPDGKLYFADGDGNQIVRIDPARD
jgi:hypothetical protein